MAYGMNMSQKQGFKTRGVSSDKKKDPYRRQAMEKMLSDKPQPPKPVRY